MPEIILSINAGSSSVKISVYKTPENDSRVPTQLAEATVEGLTAPPANLKYERGDEKIKGKELENVNTQEDGFRYILDHLTNDEGLTELNRKEDIHFTCHRVVHGGDYPKSQVIDKETYHHIEELSDLAPSTTHPHSPSSAPWPRSFHMRRTLHTLTLLSITLCQTIYVPTPSTRKWRRRTNCGSMGFMASAIPSSPTL
ncbi:hypothetical protein P3342_008921 [Pyrenophora teres f. teres]|nr:hypothetical protein P3342_008921 [Pyrenophora teres f. teres]